jgi:predicted transcriptional regulator of viral defense system
VDEPLPRTLGSRQAEVVSWLEADRRRSVTSRDVVDHFAWTEPTASNVLSDLTKKHWLRRVARGVYEFLPAESGGFRVDDPWPALANWSANHYVGFRSAAYQLGLTPDRPGQVQVAVPFGVRRPRAWGATAIVLLHQRDYSDAGVKVTAVTGWQVHLSGAERTILDGAIQPRRIGGIPELVRILVRAHRTLDWNAVMSYAEILRRGRTGIRRLGALAELLELAYPKELKEAAGSPRSRLYLGDTTTYGSAGRLIRQWNVVDNIGPSALGELSR